MGRPEPIEPQERTSQQGKGPEAGGPSQTLIMTAYALAGVPSI